MRARVRVCAAAHPARAFRKSSGKKRDIEMRSRRAHSRRRRDRSATRQRGKAPREDVDTNSIDPPRCRKASAKPAASSRDSCNRREDRTRPANAGDSSASSRSAAPRHFRVGDFTRSKSVVGRADDSIPASPARVRSRREHEFDRRRRKRFPDRCVRVARRGRSHARCTRRGRRARRRPPRLTNGRFADAVARAAKPSPTPPTMPTPTRRERARRPSSAREGQKKFAHFRAFGLVRREIRHPRGEEFFLPVQVVADACEAFANARAHRRKN
ncbi:MULTISPECIES: hypothetical protein [unclassified Lysobacter]|uniref:hypothetical protein n=1 Tax=unclassified Lysobacter TaxID=2635362 RepID=UPI001BEBFE7B|nr:MULTISPECIES: hypothetical protein [unclassified Lysobacter]MBT2746434.1 hypothetical protein [Lysobacter sp. ISL-42]MBT2753209.1 hypothetical protein [Lysobacter sp. ISL-50]MBT2783333.1 hypothetical protein [Lysobacter sp. ISL-52]